jgi:hypothetical protein
MRFQDHHGLDGGRQLAWVVLARGLHWSTIMHYFEMLIREY